MNKKVDRLHELHNILKHLSLHPEGISSYFLAQEMKEGEQNLRHKLLQAIADGFVRKNGPKFFLTSDIFVNNGFLIFYDKGDKQFMFLGCPYYIDQSCPCSKTGTITRECRLLDDMKYIPVVKRFLKSKLGKEIATRSLKDIKVV